MKRYQWGPLLTLVMATGMTGWAQQSKKETPKNWHQLNVKESGFHGINLDKAYEFLKTRKAKSQTVVVAVIDSGIDTLHEDLKPVLWVNPGEIPGNGKDDDKNGYPDDRNGWNFIGGKDGTNINDNSSEASRIYHQWRSKYEGKNVTGLDAADQAEYKLWQKAKDEMFGNEENKIDVTLFRRMYTTLMKSDSVMRKGTGNENYTGKELEAYKSQNSDERKAKDQLLNFMRMYEKMDMPAKGLLSEFGEFIDSEEKKEKEKTTAPRDWRGEIVKDNPDDLNDRNYGNGDVMAGRARHGTHVAGIIGAVRNNGKGMDGVADDVRLMVVRVVPDGDEHDKDVANGIRYAVDNGAQVINMSFGKAISPKKAWVDDAVKYAESKGVLLVHAAGNDNEDVDVNDNFPVAIYNNGQKANNWITVGASGDPTNGGLVANFSNYGKKEVDVFAPGVDIYSTVPGGNTYDKISGTSMAAPVVSGLAALLMEYFPTLSAKQVKFVIERSAVPFYTKVTKPGTEESVPFLDLSKTGGIVDAFAAVKLAATLKGEKKVQAKTAKAVKGSK
jgi:cell wall-associated protease